VFGPRKKAFVSQMQKLAPSLAAASSSLAAGSMDKPLASKFVGTYIHMDTPDKVGNIDMVVDVPLLAG
jgi:hypothetical protein